MSYEIINAKKQKLRGTSLTPPSRCVLSLHVLFSFISHYFFSSVITYCYVESILFLFIAFCNVLHSPQFGEHLVEKFGVYYETCIFNWPSSRRMPVVKKYTTKYFTLWISKNAIISDFCSWIIIMCRYSLLIQARLYFTFYSVRHTFLEVFIN